MAAIRLFATMGWLLAFAAGADAHAIDVQVRIEEAGVVVEAYYDDDAPAIEAKAIIFDEDGRAVAEGRTNSQGVWRPGRLPPGRYRVTVDAGDGHLAKRRFTVPAATDDAAIVSDGPTRAETTGARRWLLTAFGLAAIAAGTMALRYFSRRRSATRA